MPINADKPQLWKADVERSIDFYNDWFLRFAPDTYRTQRQTTMQAVLQTFSRTGDLIAWAEHGQRPGKRERERAATVIADRMCGAASDPIIGSGNIELMTWQRSCQRSSHHRSHAIGLLSIWEALKPPRKRIARMPSA